MAGHSKWAQIKRKKAVTDARRGQLWSRLLKEVTVAARMGGEDPGGNPRLRSAIQEAKAANVPNDNIDRAVQRGAGLIEGAIYEEIAYEGYGPGGVAILVETVTDNRNRTVAEIRHYFSKYGGNLGENGCVGWMFEKRGYFAIDRSEMSEEEFMDLALEIGADDIETEDETYEIFVSPDSYLEVRALLEEKQVSLATAELAMLPQTYVDLEAEVSARVLRLMEALEEQDDVQNVWANVNLDDQVLAGQSGSDRP